MLGNDMNITKQPNSSLDESPPQMAAIYLLSGGARRVDSRTW